MKKLFFSEEKYENDKYMKTEDSQVGRFEFLWVIVSTSQAKLEKKELRAFKSLKRKLRDISHFKDNDKDSRILNTGSQLVYLDTDEYEVIIKVLNSVLDYQLNLQYAEDFDTLWSIIDNASNYEPPKLAIEHTTNID